jgi:tetratricopeptide (TPR) repeat protein
MVITMMGINDSGSHLPYEAATNSKIRLFLKTLRTYKLARLLWLHIVSKIKAIGIYRQKDLLTTNKLRERSTTQTDPGNKDAREAYIDLAWRYKTQGNYPEAEALFKKALEINPRNESAYVGLGVLSEAKGNYTEAEALFKKALEINPVNDSAYLALGTFLQFRQRDAEVEALLKKASELNPKNYSAPYQLGRTYVIQCRYDEAEVWFKKALAINPQNSFAYLGLGWVYMTQKKYAQAEELFKRLIELTPENDMGYRGLVALYEEMGRLNLAKDYANKADSLCNPIPRNNYRRLKEVLNQRGVKFICMQYPVRSVKPLKDLFKGEDGVIFVDNEKIFKDALKKGNSKDYFTDMFGGDFGHCTRTGNRIIAENVADVILKECFHK